MMNALLKNSNVERFIHISTSEVYGTSENELMDENHILNPRSPYAGAKAGADRLVYSYWCTYDVPAVIIRPFNNFGPNQHLEKMIPRFITSAIKNEPLTIHGDGSAMRDWLFVEDHCEGLDKAIHVENFDSIKNQVINLGTSKPTSNLEIAEYIINVFGLPYSMLKFIGDRPGQVCRHAAAIEKADKLLNWQPRTEIKDGLLKTIEWYKSNQEWWRPLEWMKQVPVYTRKNIVEMH